MNLLARLILAGGVLGCIYGLSAVAVPVRYLVPIELPVQFVDLLLRVLYDLRGIRCIDGAVWVFLENGYEICLRGNDNFGTGG